MDLLGIFYSCVAILFVLGLALLFFIKNKKYNNIILITITLFCVLTTLLSISSMPSNYIAEKLIAGVIGFVCIIGCGMRFKCQDYSLLPKLLVAISIISTYLFMLL